MKARRTARRTSLAIGLALFQFWGDWLHIGLVAGIFALGQVTEGNFLTPKLVGSSVGKVLELPRLRDAYQSALRRCVSIAGEPAADDRHDTLSNHLPTRGQAKGIVHLREIHPCAEPNVPSCQKRTL